MQKDFSKDLKSSTLYVKCYGQFEYADVLALIDEILERCDSDNLHFVLVDALEILDGDLPIHQRFFIGVEIAKRWKFDLKAAFLYPEKWINKLSENVANNRGANIMVTHDRDKANKWLYSDE